MTNPLWQAAEAFVNQNIKQFRHADLELSIRYVDYLAHEGGPMTGPLELPKEKT